MSFAEGLLLAYLKVGVLAAAILAVLWVVGKGFQALYAWSDNAAPGKPPSGKAAGDDASKDGAP